jgi:hypothetical protein
MPEDSPGAFSLYVDWLYRGSVPRINAEAHVKQLYELYFLANKFCLIELKDKTMDTIQDMAKKYNLKDELIKPGLVVRVIQNTPTKREGLRRFCIDQMVWVYLSRWYDTQVGYDQSEHEYEKNNDDDNKDDENHPYLMRKDAKAVFRICTETNDCRFLESFLNRLIWLANDGVHSETLDNNDPRDRYLHYVVGGCKYHCHEVFVNCHYSRDQVDDIFIRDEDNSNTPTS